MKCETPRVAGRAIGHDTGRALRSWRGFMKLMSAATSVAEVDPSLHTLVQLAKVLGVEVNELLKSE